MKYPFPLNYLLLLAATLILSCTKPELKPVLPPVQDSTYNIITDTDTALTVTTDSIPSVIICSQTWTLKNLDVTTFRNGDTILQITNSWDWDNLFLSPSQPAWCYYAFDSTIGSEYGKLYNWAAITDPRGLAPEGWHVATYAEWVKLADSCLGGIAVAGRALKETGDIHWDDARMPVLAATNSSGLTCLGGGYREGSFFQSLKQLSSWWCGTGDSTGRPYVMYLNHIFNDMFFKSASQQDAVYVRCVKD